MEWNSTDPVYIVAAGRTIPPTNSGDLWDAQFKVTISLILQDIPTVPIFKRETIPNVLFQDFDVADKN